MSPYSSPAANPEFILVEHRAESLKTAAIIQNPDALQEVPQLHDLVVQDDDASDDGGPLNDNSTAHSSGPDNATTSTSAKKDDSNRQLEAQDSKQPGVRVQYKTPPGRAAKNLPKYKARRGLASINITGMRCSITNAAGPAGVQMAHVIARATPDDDVSKMEEVLGIIKGGFNLDSNLNVLFLIQPVHDLFDSSLAMIVPSLLHLQEVASKLDGNSAKRPSGRADIELANSLAGIIPPALKGHVYEYFYVPLDPTTNIHDWHKLLGRYRLESDPIQDVRQAEPARRSLGKREGRTSAVAMFLRLPRQRQDRTPPPLGAAARMARSAAVP
ncbi:hypothetical protein FISHEDRAFT_60338 [Fistulina hepatica ATCC 64428]|uniref:HNH nuclease domain-containing protein n=1 Tax=Fistulina hepatica ATCC 64428 TaxID=1128425 RepID=A0A0D7A977_9AGAR|nr:hypothetical protein FISHEDRAFT_60338 [Fistulina hepatica ATCC 64428]